MDYEYDVFVSYKRERLRNEWLLDPFLPHLVAYLTEEVANIAHRRLAPIVIDQAAVNPTFSNSPVDGVEGFAFGEDWRVSLRQIISRCRCLVAVWSPAYFLSPICVAEWRSFHVRNMVAPLSVHDGESFPEAARALQRMDMDKFYYHGGALRTSDRFILFQESMKRFSALTAQKIVKAPPWEDWQLIEDDPQDPPPIDLPTF